MQSGTYVYQSVHISNSSRLGMAFPRRGTRNEEFLYEEFLTRKGRRGKNEEYKPYLGKTLAI